MSKLKDTIDKLPQPKRHISGEGGLAWAKREYESLVDLQMKGFPISAIKRMREIWWNAYKAGWNDAATENLTYVNGKSDAITEMQILLDKMTKAMYDEKNRP